jgi:DNA repair exonuclease SbcCD nuclease subunit
MELKFIHTGDIHLGTSFKSASFGKKIGKKRRDEIKETFFRIIDRCEQNKVHLLLIAGDLFDDDYITISELKDINKKLEKLTMTKVIISAGNHDAIINDKSNFNLINWSSNIYIANTNLCKIELEDLNTDIYSFSWDKKEIKEMDLTNITIEESTKNNILMLHGDIYTKSNYLPLDVNSLLGKGFDYIALGHIHKADIISSKCAYCGSPEPLDFKETGHHGMVEGIINSPNVTCNFIPFSKREFTIEEIEVNETMTSYEIEELVIDKISNIKKSSLVRLIIKGTKDADIEIDIDKIKEKIESIIFYCEVVDKTRNNYHLERIKQDNEGNIIGEFIKYMEQKGLDNELVRDALKEGMNILLNEKVN